MYFDIRTISGRLIGLHCKKDLESLTQEELVGLVNDLVTELDDLKTKLDNKND